MAVIRQNFFLVSLALCFVLSLVTEWYTELSVILFIVSVLANLDKLGKGLVLRELVALYSIFICLVMPAVGYNIYNQDNFLARIFYKYMFVPEGTYYTYAMPAICAFAWSLCFPVKYDGNVLDEGESFKKSLKSVRQALQTHYRTGITIVSVGVLTYFFLDYIPGVFNFAFTLLFFSSFAGILYIYYSPPFPFKNILLVLFSLFVVGLAIQSGVFTIVVYMGITLFSFLFLGRKYALWKKFVVFLIGCFLLIIVQSVKEAYREITWKEKAVDNKGSVFVDVALDKLTNFDKLFNVDGFFPIYMRTNQGFNVARVMYRIPSKQDFDNGSHLFVTTASALVPRFLWPDKAEAGGVENMKYFANIDIYGWSTNVSPLGEAYGSFGPVIGILYMFLLGFFIRWVYKRVFVVSQKIPLLILWIPVLFYQITYSMETDSLQIFNSLIKGAFFLWLLYKLLPGWFGKGKLQYRKKRQPLLRYHFNDQA